jgi:hypothetical protein
MDDVASALTDSLDRQGRGGMLAPFRFADGTAGAPSMTWTNETNTGFYRAGSQDMRAVVSGVDATRWIDDGAGGSTFQIFDDSDSLWKDAAHENSIIRLGDGAAATPALTWFNETTDGLYRVGDGDQRYVQDVGATPTDVWKALNGVLNVNYGPYADAGTPADFPVIGERLRNQPEVGDPVDTVASIGYVDSRLTLVAQGVGDGNSSTFVGDVFGTAASWTRTSEGNYTLGLSDPLTSLNNLVVHLTVQESGDSAGRYVFVTGVTTPATPKITIRSNAGGQATALDPDVIMFSVYDSGV